MMCKLNERDRFAQTTYEKFREAARTHNPESRPEVKIFDWNFPNNLQIGRHIHVFWRYRTFDRNYIRLIVSLSVQVYHHKSFYLVEPLLVQYNRLGPSYWEKIERAEEIVEELIKMIRTAEPPKGVEIINPYY